MPLRCFQRLGAARAELWDILMHYSLARAFYKQGDVQRMLNAACNGPLSVGGDLPVPQAAHRTRPLHPLVAHDLSMLQSMAYALELSAGHSDFSKEAKEMMEKSKAQVLLLTDEEVKNWIEMHVHSP